MAMKWINPEDKEPVFEYKYLLLDDKGYWQPGYLKEIKTTAGGSEYVWYDISSEEIMQTITHYMNIEPLKSDFKL